MDPGWFRRARRARPAFLALAALPLVAGVLRAQDPGTDPRSFEPRYIDPAEFRDRQVLLHDWPALSELVRWSAPLAEAIAMEDATLDPDLLGQLRERLGALTAAGPPAFLSARRDSVAAILDGVEARLDQAEALLADTVPGEIGVPTGEERPNVSDRDRTYTTGPTAVTVPAGVDVGEADSLPGAELEGGTPVTYVDLVADALDELDRLVHLVRKVGATPSPGGARDPRSPGTGAPPREP